jgi:hypothetical protein
MQGRAATPEVQTSRLLPLLPAVKSGSLLQERERERERYRERERERERERMFVGVRA